MEDFAAVELLLLLLVILLQLLEHESLLLLQQGLQLRWRQDLLHLLLQLTGPQQPPVMVEPDLEVTASVVHDNVPAVLDVLDGVCLLPRDAGSIEESLPLSRAEGNCRSQKTNRFEFLTVYRATIQQYGVDGVASSRCLNMGWGDVEHLHGVVVAVNHDRPSAPQVDVFLPPVTHIICGPPGF